MLTDDLTRLLHRRADAEAPPSPDLFDRVERRGRQLRRRGLAGGAVGTLALAAIVAVTAVSLSGPAHRLRTGPASVGGPGYTITPDLGRLPVIGSGHGDPEALVPLPAGDGCATPTVPRPVNYLDWPCVRTGPRGAVDRAWTNVIEGRAVAHPALRVIAVGAMTTATGRHATFAAVEVWDADGGDSPMSLGFATVDTHGAYILNGGGFGSVPTAAALAFYDGGSDTGLADQAHREAWDVVGVAGTAAFRVHEPDGTTDPPVAAHDGFAQVAVKAITPAEWTVDSLSASGALLGTTPFSNHGPTPSHPENTNYCLQDLGAAMCTGPDYDCSEERVSTLPPVADTPTTWPFRGDTAVSKAVSQCALGVAHPDYLYKDDYGPALSVTRLAAVTLPRSGDGVLVVAWQQHVGLIRTGAVRVHAGAAGKVSIVGVTTDTEDPPYIDGTLTHAPGPLAAYALDDAGTPSVVIVAAPGATDLTYSGGLADVSLSGDVATTARTATSGDTISALIDGRTVTAPVS